MGHTIATTELIGLVISVVALAVTIAWNAYSARRNRRKDGSEEMATLKADLEAQIVRSQKGAHARMTGIETNYNAKFAAVTANVNVKHEEQMTLIRQLLEQQAEQQPEIQAIRINLKNLMQHNNVPYQE